MGRQDGKDAVTPVLRHLEVFALDDVQRFRPNGLVNSLMHRRRAKLSHHERLQRKPVSAEIRNPFHGGDGLTDLSNRLQQFRLLLILHKGKDANTVPLRKNSYVVIHPNAASMKIQDRRVRRDDQNVHDSCWLRVRTSRSLSTYCGALWTRRRNASGNCRIARRKPRISKAGVWLSIARA